MTKIDITAINKALLPFVLCAWSLLANAEQEIYLQFSEQPNRSVELTRSTNSELVLDLKGDERLLEKNRQRGVTFPLKLSNYKNQKISTITGPVRADGSFQVERRIEDVTSYTEDKDGNRVRTREPIADMVGLVFSGTVDSVGKMKFEHLTGGNVDAEKQKILQSIVESMALHQSTPEHPLRVGDSFSTQTPLAIPVLGQQPVQVNTTEKYTFKRMQGDKAVFDVTVTFSLSNPKQDFHVEADGSGSGVMEYNVKNKLREKLTLDFDMGMIVQVGNVEMSSQLRSHSTTEQVILDPAKQRPDKEPDPKGGPLPESSAG